MTIEKPKQKSRILSAFRQLTLRFCRESAQPVQVYHDEDGKAWRGMIDGSCIGRMPELDKKLDVEKK